jgi:hypothetical protein
MRVLSPRQNEAEKRNGCEAGKRRDHHIEPSASAHLDEQTLMDLVRYSDLCALLVYSILDQYDCVVVAVQTWKRCAVTQLGAQLGSISLDIEIRLTFFPGGVAEA